MEVLLTLHFSVSNVVKRTGVVAVIGSMNKKENIVRRTPLMHGFGVPMNPSYERHSSRS